MKKVTTCQRRVAGTSTTRYLVKFILLRGGEDAYFLRKTSAHYAKTKKTRYFLYFIITFKKMFEALACY